MKRPDQDELAPMDVVVKRETPRHGRADTPEKSAALVVTPHPMTTQGQRVLDARAAALLPGETLASFLERHGVVAGQQWVVSLGGVDVPERNWRRIRPKHGHLIEARRVPQQDALKFVALAVLTYYTMGAGGMAGGSFLGMTGFTGYLAAGVAMMAGVMVLNRMLGPKRPDGPGTTAATSPTYSLTGGRNRVRPFEPMALVLGEPYCVPDLAAQPYTYFANGEQYLWQLFHAGINCASVSNIRIGQTAIANYQNVALSYEGFAAGNTGLPLLSNVDAVAGALLDAPSAPGPWVTRTSSVNANELAVDVEGTLFSLNQGSGAYESLLMEIEIQYRLVGAATWESFYVTPPYTVTVAPHLEYDSETGNFIEVAGYSYTYTPTGIEIRNGSTKPVRATYSRKVETGQYEVRARKLTANATASNQQNMIQWTTLKTYQVDSGNYKGQSRLGVQIQASGQLNGSLDEVNWMAVGKPMPYWDGSAWVTATSRTNGLSNPGAQFLLLARGIYDEDGRLLAGLGWSDAQIDIEGLKGFMVWCAAKGLTYDYFLQENMSIGDLLESVAAAGLGAVSWHTGKLGVIWFADDQPTESVLNMASMKVRSFSVDYTTMATADEIEFQYFDRDRGNTWKSIRVLAPGVTTPTATGRQPLQGVTTEAQAAVLGRFYMAQNIYQRKLIGADVDLEHLTFRRGTVMALSHDLTQWGYGGRVQSAVNAAGTVTLTLDDVVPAVGPSGQTSRYVGLRLLGESQFRIFPVAAFSGTSRSLTLDSAWPVGVAVPGDSADNPAHDTLWIYDFKATPGQRVRVASIEPQGNLGGARVAFVPESDEFWNYVWTGTYIPPPNNSLLQGAPRVTRAIVTEQLGRQGNTYFTELTATFDVTGSYDRAELWGAVGDGQRQLLASTRSTSVSWRGGLSETWMLELRAFSSVLAAPPFIFSYQVKGLAVRPPNVTSFSIDGNRFTWDAVPNTPDLAGYQIRFNYGSRAWWETASPLHRGLLVSSPYEPPQLPAGAVFLIKAIDTSGNDSALATQVLGPQSALVVRNVLQSWVQDPTFAGQITGGTVSAGVLQATLTDSFYGSPQAPFYGADNDPFYSVSSALELVYEFDVPVYEAGRLLLQYTLIASNFKIEFQRGSTMSFYGAPNSNFYGPASDPFYGAPQSWAIWPGYLELSGPAIVKFRFTLEAGATRGQIFALAALLDVPDIVIQLNDVVIAPGGTRLALGQTVHAVKAVHLTLQNDGGTGVSYLAGDKNSPLGPLATVLDASQASVSGLVDAEITAY